MNLIKTEHFKLVLVSRACLGSSCTQLLQEREKYYRRESSVLATYT